MASQPTTKEIHKKSNLPKELTDLVYKFPKTITGFRECGLCELPLLSNVVANDHYAGHKHRMKVNVWLRDHGHESLIVGGCPPAPVVTSSSSKKRKAASSSAAGNVKKKAKKSVDNSAAFGYCNICDVKLSSESNATDHFEGQRHKKNFLKYRKEGNFETDNYGIGEAFKKQKEELASKSTT